MPESVRRERLLEPRAAQPTGSSRCEAPAQAPETGPLAVPAVRHPPDLESHIRSHLKVTPFLRQLRAVPSPCTDSRFVWPADTYQRSRVCGLLPLNGRTVLPQRCSRSAPGPRSVLGHVAKGTEVAQQLTLRWEMTLGGGLGSV